MSALKKIEVRFAGPEGTTTVGTLVQRRHRIYFEYAGAWLDRGLELSPFTLPSRPGLLEHSDRQFGPLFGLFDDSLPDGWGLLLMDRHFRKQGVAPATVSPLDRLAYLGTRTMGALTYHPPASREDTGTPTLDLHRLGEEARQVHAGGTTEVLPQLMRAGGSPGGARPKVLVGFNRETDELVSGEDDLPSGFEHWMVKFSAGQDLAQAGAVEYAYSLMAREAGLEMPETRLFETAEGDRFFGVRRFDRRAGNHRVHAHTFGNLIHADFRVPGCDYAELLRATSILTRDHQDVLRAFRLMVFNVLAHNRDDHVKNFAFLLDAEEGRWALSPAYDLIFAAGPGGEHTTTVNGEGRAPAEEHMLALAGPAGVEPRAARRIIDRVRQAVSRWPEVAERAGVAERTAGMVAAALTGAQ